MFTGIIEDLAKVIDISHEKENITFTLSASIANEFKIDQSVAHDGVCLTVVDVKNKEYKVTAIKETLDISNLKNWKVGDTINLERSMSLSARLDGHMVQGHVDQIGRLDKIEDQNGSFKLSISYDAKDYITVSKGSICVNGISLTVVDSEAGFFSVAIIPYTWENTNLSQLNQGSEVNLEFDILGKYVSKLLENQS